MNNTKYFYKAVMVARDRSMWSTNQNFYITDSLLKYGELPHRNYHLSKGQVIRYRLNQTIVPPANCLQALFIFDNLQDCCNYLRDEKGEYYILKGIAVNPRRYNHSVLLRSDDPAVDKFGSEVYCFCTAVLCDSFTPKIIIGKSIENEPKIFR